MDGIIAFRSSILEQPPKTQEEPKVLTVSCRPDSNHKQLVAMICGELFHFACSRVRSFSGLRAEFKKLAKFDTVAQRFVTNHCGAKSYRVQIPSPLSRQSIGANACFAIGDGPKLRRCVGPKRATRLSVSRVDLVSSRLTRPCGSGPGSLRSDGSVPASGPFLSRISRHGVGQFRTPAHWAWG
jgi:hypothetical protein